MALETPCKTPGAKFETHINENIVEIRVTCPINLALDELDAIELETTIHNALEMVLAPIFVAAKHDDRYMIQF